LTQKTHSPFLVEEWDTMMQWKSAGDKDLNRDECPEVWSRITRSVEEGRHQVHVQYRTSGYWQEFKETEMTYAKQVMDDLDEALGLPLDSYASPVPPWSQSEQ
jgi:hypothetical protein